MHKSFLKRLLNVRSKTKHKSHQNAQVLETRLKSVLSVHIVTTKLKSMPNAHIVITKHKLVLIAQEAGLRLQLIGGQDNEVAVRFLEKFKSILEQD